MHDIELCYISNIHQEQCVSNESNISWYVFEPTSHCLLLDHDTDQNLHWMPNPSNLGRNSPKNNHPESGPAFLPCARAHVARTTTACSPRWRNNQRVQNQQRRCTRIFQMWKRFHFTLAQRMKKILNTCWAHFEGWVCSWSIRSMSRQNCQTCQTFPSSSPAHCSMLCWLFETSTSTFTMSIHLKPFRYCRLCHWVLEWLKVVAVITSGKRRGERLFDHLTVPFGCFINKSSWQDLPPQPAVSLRSFWNVWNKRYVW